MGGASHALLRWGARAGRHRGSQSLRSAAMGSARPQKSSWRRLP